LSDDHSTFEGRLVPTLIVVFAVIGVLVVVDILADVSEGTTAAHIAVEAGIGLVALIGVAALVWRVVGLARNARRRAEKLGHDLETSRRDAVEWRTEAQDLIKGLGAKIDDQFAKWHLTPAEKEVALFLLKGFSHRDIARLREVSEATARQQARAIYRKAGITGRHDLAGFFLEDLVLPPEQPGADAASSSVMPRESRAERLSG
jgi:DNA-binding CsgD family transcriptional regulator